MAVITIKAFGGIAPAVPARYLEESQAQIAVNSPVWRGSLSGQPDLGTAVHTLTKNTVAQTIYRFGQNTLLDDRYWFHWGADVDVCRSQIANDSSEWTFYTGDGVPKATYNAIGVGSTDYPTVSRPLGLPAPTNAAAATANSFTADQHPAEVTLTSGHIDALTTTWDLLISTDEDDAADYVTVALSSALTATSVKSDIEANSTLNPLLDVTTDGNSVTIKTVATGPTAKLFVKFQTGVDYNEEGTFSKDATPNLSDTGSANSPAYVVVLDSEIGSIASSDKITLITNSSTVINDVTVGSTQDAASFASWINSRASSKVTATAYGSCVVLTPGTEGGGSSGFIQYKRKSGSSFVTNQKVNGSESAAPARIFVTQTHIDAMEGQYLWLKVNSQTETIKIPSTAYVNQLTSLTAYNLTVTIFGAIEPFAVVETTAVGTNASLNIRTGSYPEEAVYSLLNGEGYEDDDLTEETRVYAYTWVNKESGFEFESAPSPASNSVDVKAGQTVSLSGLDPVPGGDYVVTNRRIYRSTSGVYLFVKEISAAQSSFTDDVEADSLGEQMPSLNWAAPPGNLAGLTNLPNGLMAGFVGRDVYFCDPYHPHAWPEGYSQSVDYPVVGLAAMDTTLAVLTTGVPYFIQGTHPESMAVVKSDLQQACVSKRSIVEIGGVVLYAAPDGLMALSPGGSKIVTENLFNFQQWQTFFKPESIHAYHHDNQYIAFYDNGSLQGGFTFDMRSGNFITHDIYAEAGYQDLQTDKLYVAVNEGTASAPDMKIKVWQDGDVKEYQWRSKKFTLPHTMGFSCGQVEAEAYGNLTAKFYLDGNLIHTQTVSSRDPFRLPAKKGRDLEIELVGDEEVFSLAVANSMTELAGV